MIRTQLKSVLGSCSKKVMHCRVCVTAAQPPWVYRIKIAFSLLKVYILFDIIPHVYIVLLYTCGIVL